MVAVEKKPAEVQGQLVEVFRRMCLIRYFELQVKDACEKGYVQQPVYLSVGQESIASAISMVCKDYYILAQHRCHSVYLAFGGDPKKLIDELLGLKSGCTKGLGLSASIQCPEIKMIGHHGLIGENVPLAVGVALGSHQPTVCFFGDGACEEDYIFPSLGFAVTHKLPILFVCEDNDLSILTEKKVRRSWEMCGVAQAMGMEAVDMDDDPFKIMSYAKSLTLPMFMNIRTCRHLWHAGTGKDNEPKWDRFKMVKEQVKGADKIESEIKDYIEELWWNRLQDVGH